VTKPKPDQSEESPKRKETFIEHKERANEKENEKGNTEIPKY